MSNPYAPPDESSADLWLERSNFVGAVLCGVAYGVHLTVFCICAHYLVHNMRHTRGSRNLEFLVFIFLMFAMGTLNIAGNTAFSEHMWIDDRNIPGGPNAWLTTHYSEAVDVMGNVGYVVANFMADGLLLWRTYTIWNSVFVIFFPCLIYLGSTAMSIIVLFQTSRLDANLWSSVSVSFFIPYFSLSIALNIILTMLIVGKLLYMSRSVRNVLGEQHARTYTSVAAMIVESAAPYSLTSVIFIITYGRGSNVQNLLLPVLSQVMCIAPEMIILRVAKGHAWSSDTTRSMMHDKSSRFIAFGKPNTETTTSIMLSDFTGNISARTNDTSTVAASKYKMTQESQVSEHV